jgi:hypothetical protein
MGFQHVMPFNFLAKYGDVLGITSGEVTFGTTSNTLNVTIPACVLDKTLLLFSYKDTSTDSTGQDDENCIRGQLSSTTNISFKTHTTPNASKTIQYYLIHFTSLSPVTIHRGTHSLTGTTDNITIPAVTLANAFPIHSMTTNAGNMNAAWMVTFDITTTTNIALNTSVNRTQTIEWQVVDHPNWPVTRTTISITAGNSLGTVTVPAYTQADVWITGSYKYDASFISAEQIPVWYTLSTTQIRMRRTSTTGQHDAIIYCVDGGGDFVNNFNRGTISATGTDSNSAFTAAQRNTVAYFNGMGSGRGDDNSNAGANNAAENVQMKLKITSSGMNLQRVGTLYDLRWSFQALDFTPSITHLN